ncbi:sigma-70 family RNA polymerase sigma factor [Aquisalibacillus elongatus]|uniref:RNA polymerase sigma factor n=1 Tax=Aquisalibacillus elongatus TaxID=485577 RepID=A0A3N5B754_9BACI|nr:sigma-70 family RNA polymerase sigma factor [Aquisalibacillus elongatus]RPF53193.1 RNA polymerase sigma (SigV) subunit [Aquisalibacillus elongatus]
MSDSFEAINLRENLTEQERLTVLETCMNQYGHDIFRLVHSYVHNYSDADDLTQDVFVKVYEKIHTFNGESSLKSWIYRIAINTCKDYLRSFQSKQRKLKEKFQQLLNEPEIPTPEEQSIEQETHSQLLLYVDQLPLKYREIIILYYFEELSLNELSEALGLNNNTAKARLRRARERLKLKLEDGGELYG